MKRATLWRRLLEQARHLSTVDPRRPREANLRRAVSTAYYALFHFIVDEATTDWFGPETNARPLRDVVGRAYAHTEMATACKSFAGGTLKSALTGRLPSDFAIPLEIQEIARMFRIVQDERHRADYDLSVATTFQRSDVLPLIEDVEGVIENRRSASGSLAARLFLASMLTWKQIEHRG